jgi:long-chain fatty acid transport protein
MAAGYNIGLLWKPLVEHSFGITYRSATSVDFKGHSTLTAPIALPAPLPQARESASATIDFPQQIVVGWSYHPSPNWNFEFNADWTDWDVLNTVTLHRVAGSDPMIFNYQSSFMFEWGATRFLKNGWSVSGGYIYSQSSVPVQFFSPAVPDADRHVLSAGFGKQYRWLRMDAAYQFGFSPEWSINNASPADGKYTFTSHALALSLGVAF